MTHRSDYYTGKAEPASFVEAGILASWRTHHPSYRAAGWAAFEGTSGHSSLVGRQVESGCAYMIVNILLEVVS